MLVPVQVSPVIIRLQWFRCVKFDCAPGYQHQAEQAEQIAEEPSEGADAPQQEASAPETERAIPMRPDPDSGLLKAVLTGLRPGERYVVAPGTELTDGRPIEVQG